jgi:hypothetical protein
MMCVMLSHPEVYVCPQYLAVCAVFSHFLESKSYLEFR